MSDSYMIHVKHSASIDVFEAVSRITKPYPIFTISKSLVHIFQEFARWDLMVNRIMRIAMYLWVLNLVLLLP